MFNLLIIDPQNDFVESPRSVSRPDPALPIPGSYQDMKNIAKLIGAREPSKIFVSLDSHNVLDISHPTFWKKEDGSPVVPFTNISIKDLGTKYLVDPSLVDVARVYLEALDRAGITHTVWPEHCLTGCWGSNIHPIVGDALHSWERSTLKVPKYIYKGLNPYTEHFSAFKAVVSNMDESTQFNYTLLDKLTEDRNTIVVVGEASSHCVNETVRHMIDKVEEYLDRVRIILLTDCMSPVAGCEFMEQDFLKYASEHGACPMTLNEFLDFEPCQKG